MKGGKTHENETVVCAVYHDMHDMHDDDSGMWTIRESGEEKIGKSRAGRNRI